MKQLMIAAMMILAAAATPALAEEDEWEGGGWEEIKQLEAYLDLSERFVALSKNKDVAVYFAIEGVVEIYEARGDTAKVIPILEGYLDGYPDNLAVRNIIRFKLRDLYRETGQTDLALEQMMAVIEENK